MDALQYVWYLVVMVETFKESKGFSFKTIHECKCVWASVVRANQDLVVANALICFRHRVWGLTCLKKGKKSVFSLISSKIHRNFRFSGMQ